MAKKITFQDPKSRRVGLLCDDEGISRQIKEWVDDDHGKLLMLCKHYGIKEDVGMFYQLALTLAREIYPEPKKRGRKSKWTILIKGVLVVEVERLMRPDDPAYGVEWACTQLSKREPWASFIEKKESGTLAPDPTEALRQTYYDFRNDPWANISRDAFRMHEHERTITEWDKRVGDSVRNPHPK